MSVETIQDTGTEIIKDVAEELRDSLQEAYDVLIERRDRQYADAIEPLDVEAEALRQEHVSLGAAARNLELLLPATAREAQREADRLMLDGKHEEAAAKIAEAEEARSAPAAMKERQQAITARIAAIESEKKDAARRVFRSWHQDCQKIIRPIERGLFVTILDGLQDSFYEFQARTGTAGDGVLNTLFKLGDITDLTANEHSLEWKSGHRWYGGRG